MHAFAEFLFDEGQGLGTRGGEGGARTERGPWTGKWWRFDPVDPHRLLNGGVYRSFAVAAMRCHLAGESGAYNKKTTEVVTSIFCAGLP